jgi:hypothetical protein
MLEERPNFHSKTGFFPPTAPDSGIVEKVFNLFAHEIPIDAEGEIAWQQAGPLDTGALMKVFNKHLAGGEPAEWRQLSLRVREGKPAPDFLFEYLKGRKMALRKLRGRERIG